MSRPRLSTSCSPVCIELNWPRSGCGLRTRNAPSPNTTGASASSSPPTTTKTKSYESENARIVVERSVLLVESVGHARSALSRPIRVDSPAARIIPQIPVLIRFYCRGGVSDSLNNLGHKTIFYSPAMPHPHDTYPLPNPPHLPPPH